MKKKVKTEKIKKETSLWIQTFKKIWANPRYKAFIKLGCYVLFFVIVFTIINFRSSGTENKTVVSPAQWKSYQYQYVLNYVGLSDEPVKTFHVEGKKYEDTNAFTVVETQKSYLEKNGHYYLDDTSLSAVKEEMFFDFTKITARKIEEYRLYMNLEYNSRYTDGTVKKNYILPVSKFAKIYMNEDIQKEGNVSLALYEKDDVLQKVELDMQSYIGMKIEIVYQNIDKVKDFRVNYPLDK